MFISTSKISKTTKLHEPEGQVQFVVFEKFTSAHYAKLQEKSRYYLLIMHVKKMMKRKDRQNFIRMYVIYTCVSTLR